FHFYNARTLPFHDLLGCLRDLGCAFEVLDHQVWRERLLESVARSPGNAFAPLAAKLPRERPSPAESSRRMPQPDCSPSFQTLASLGLACPPADQGLVRRYLEYFVRSGFLQIPARRGARS